MVRKFGEINYFLTQLLSGHGYLCKYLIQPNCIYNDASKDDAEHTFFLCGRWRIVRKNLAAEVGISTVKNFCDLILNSEENCNCIASYTEALLKSKKFDLEERSIT